VTRAPRVLFVTHNVPRFPGDAAGSFVLRLAVALQDAGSEVDIIAPGAAGLPTDETLEGIRIHRVRYASDARMTLAYTGNMAETVRGSWSGRLALGQLLLAMRRAVRRSILEARRGGRPYDIVHAHWWFPSALALWGARRAGDPPLVITMHGSDVRLAEKTPAAHPVMRRVLRSAAVRTAVSAWLADSAHAIAPDGPIVVSPMPVDTRLFEQTPNATGTAEARTGLLFVGRLNAQKGLADLFHALSQAPCAALTLEVIGDGPDRSALEALADRLGLAARVRWHGALPQQALVPFYRRARAVVIPSRGEGLGLVAVEAQLCATPVIAYADGGLLDVVRPEAGGTLVTPGDLAALSQAIARVVADEESVARLGRAARQSMSARFSPKAVAARYLAHYREAAEMQGTR
jgi:glycosyltransferase involved in cell wall biosynthesis